MHLLLPFWSLPVAVLAVTFRNGSCTTKSLCQTPKPQCINCLSIALVDAQRSNIPPGKEMKSTASSALVLAQLSLITCACQVTMNTLSHEQLRNQMYFSKGTVTVRLPRASDRIAGGRFTPIILGQLRNFNPYLMEQCICTRVHQFRTCYQHMLSLRYANTSAGKGVKYFRDRNASVQHPVLTCCTCVRTSTFTVYQNTCTPGEKLKTNNILKGCTFTTYLSYISDNGAYFRSIVVPVAVTVVAVLLITMAFILALVYSLMCLR